LRNAAGVDSDVLSPELWERTERNLVDLHWLSNEGGPRPRRKEWAGATAVASDIPAEVANSLFVHAPVAEPARLISEAAAFFRRSLVWRVTAPGKLRESIGAAALAAGMRAVDPVPRMVLSAIPPLPNLPDGLTVRRVTTPEERWDFCFAAGRGFGIPPWLLRLAIPRPSAPVRPGSPGIRRFVGYVKGSPVATSAHVTTEGVVGVFFVSTVPGAPRRGYGAALTWAAADDGRREGADVSCLQATPMGQPVYENMGYRKVGDDYAWVSRFTRTGTVRALFRLLGLALLPRRNRGSVVAPPT
jgi:hypothetical protein